MSDQDLVKISALIDRLPGLVDADCSSARKAIKDCISKIQAINAERDCFFGGSRSELVRHQLIKGGLSPEFIATNYPCKLKKLRLEIDMGVVGDGDSSDFGMANTWLDLASKWPIKPECYGISTVIAIEGYLIAYLLLAERNGMIARIPQIFITERLVTVIAGDRRPILSCIPEDLMTPAVIWRAIKSNPHNLRDVPAEKVTPEMQAYAVRGYGRCISYVPENQRTPEMIRMATLNDESALQGFAPRFKKIKAKA